MKKINAHVIEAPSGRYVVVGTVPVAMCYEAAEDVLAQIADFGTAFIPRDTYKRRSFETREAAENFIRGY